MTAGAVVGADAPARLVLVGSVIVDLVLRVPALPARGGDLLANSGTFRVGGGYYVLLAAARAGMPTVYAGRFGAGPFGTRVRDALQSLGSSLALPPDEDDDTGVCVVLVEPDGERTFVTNAGVESALGASHLGYAEVRPADTVYISGYDLAYEQSGPAIAAWIPSLDPGATVVIDPGPLAADIPAEVMDPVFARANVLTLNRRERILLTRSDDPSDVVLTMKPRLAPGALLVMRDGSRGAVLSGGVLGDDLAVVDAPRVAAVDTTGAGDIHTGTFIAALASGASPVDAGARANLEASTHVGRTNG